MTIKHILAVVPVSDFESAHVWYEKLFGAVATNIPMPGQLVEWHLSDSGWVQVTVDTERAGKSLLNFAVDDLASHVAQIAARGLQPGEITGVNKGVQLAEIKDPDGNTITLIGNFRVSY